MTNLDLKSVRRGLEAWVCARWGKSASIGNVRNLGGHSGWTYGFDVLVGDDRTPLVIRIAPIGVPHRGSTDVLRQAPLLRVLHASGLPVAAVVDACGDERFFGAPFLVVHHLPGRPLTMGPDAGPSWLSPQYRQHAHQIAAQQLARIHMVDPRQLADWEQSKTPRDEIDFWVGVLERSPEADWMTLGLDLRQRLLSLLPDHYVLGPCHGDFQTNNALFVGNGEDLRVGGIVDWEVAHIGAIEHDLAWFLMMNDADAWHPVEERGGLDLKAIISSYEAALGRGVDNLSWFWALACYRIAAIASYNIRLHRSGRKPDPAWERAVASVPFFFNRAHALLDRP